MDNPGSSTTNTNNLCKLCNEKPRAYTCPRCGTGYCNVDCYKSEAHLECSESFYKQCILDELKSQEGDPVSKNKMLEILKRVHETDLNNVDLENYGISDEEEDGELEEQLDSDDEEDIPDLDKRMQDVNLDDADDVWSALTDAERQEFEALIKNGQIETLLPQWVPWWTYHTKKKLVQDMDEKDSRQEKEYPSLIDVPIFNELQKASSNVHFNLVNVIYAYAYMANYYNGDYLNCSVEATVVFIDLCDNMKLNKVYSGTESAITSVVQNIISFIYIYKFKEAANSIIQGPEESNKYFYVAVALSELYRLITIAKEELSKHKNKAGNKEFSKNCQLPYIPNNNDCPGLTTWRLMRMETQGG
ncbi:PREDICTED: zinc finger HIT domain-containing protein 2 [Dufourea novaeangliae]|uniref:zinc finger HIT domain-containing protein 2 n=1 Tax=Dufourea novaeangliae TaxID=178035 RepID=UPI0007673DAB|nr:PREDICTED: zinc finger HIT domain-containing protein 2 [Dufourea novaeangliae]